MWLGRSPRGADRDDQLGERTRPNPGGSIYSSTKFAIEGWMEGVAQEIAPLGIRSLMIEPGMMRTDFLDARSMRQGSIDIPDYAEAVAQFRSFIAGANRNQPGNPASLAARILDMAHEDQPPARFVFGADALEWAGGKVDQLRAQIDRSAAAGTAEEPARST